MKEVLVYDSQLGYYEMLKSRLKEGFNFVLFTRGMTKIAEEFDAVLFFLHEDIELIDLSRLYNAKVPIIIGLSKDVAEETTQGNIYTLNLQQTKKGLIKRVRMLLKKLRDIAA